MDSAGLLGWVGFGSFGISEAGWGTPLLNGMFGNFLMPKEYLR